MSRRVPRRFFVHKDNVIMPSDNAFHIRHNVYPSEDTIEVVPVGVETRAVVRRLKAIQQKIKTIIKEMGDFEKLSCCADKCDLSAYSAYEHCLNMITKELEGIGGGKC